MTLQFDAHGLIPVIVQDAITSEVLMMAYANQEAYDLMLSTGYTHFWSRSRKKLWRKGEESGHVQKIVSIQTDCDSDTLLVRVHQTGAACHTGAPACFNDTLYGSLDGTSAILPELARVIKDRKANPSESSYTSKLLADEDKSLKKVVEEAGELAIAGKGGDRTAQVWEAADLIFHEMVLLERLEVPMDEVFRKLADRRKGAR